MNVLFVSKKKSEYNAIRDAVSQSKINNLELKWTQKYDTALSAITKNSYDVYFIAYRLDKKNGLELAHQVIKNNPKTPIILFVEKKEKTLISKAINKGLIDYLVKDEFNVSVLDRSLRYCTKLLQMLAEAKEIKQWYDLLVQNTGVGLWEWDLKKNKIEFSTRWKSMLGHKKNEIGNKPEEWFNRIHAEDRDTVDKEIQLHLKGSTPHFQKEYRIRHKNGTHFWVFTHGVIVRDNKNKPVKVVGIQDDITGRHLTEDQLRQSAFYDTLTGLPNRILFLDRLGRAIERTKRRHDHLFAVLFLDLDRFKTVNDSLGHEVGDQLLIAASRRFLNSIRDADTAARFGGDEFAILLDNIRDISDALRVSERIQEELKEPFNLKQQQIVTSTSIGIALSSTGYTKTADCLRDADSAMYRAKARGGGAHEIFDESMHSKAVARLKTESDLRQAIKRDEFVAFYQPIISLETGSISGFEALVRWQHPEQGLLFPAEFIPIAEETGLIMDIDLLVLRQACEQMHKWHKKFKRNPGFSISTNLSRKNLDQPGLVERVKTVLKETGLDPRSLRQEITESHIMEDPDAAARILIKLKELNILLHMDDFGTGYSSLSHLLKFNIDTLKIDGSFVSNMHVRGENFEVVRSIIKLAHNLGMDVIAEGVETADQLAQLKTLKCEYAQGYHFAKPINKKAIEALLSKNPRW